MPGVSQIPRQVIGRESGEELRTSVRKGFSPEGGQDLFRLRAKIAFRYRRTDFVLSPEEPAHVPSVFAQEALGLIFWMALEMDEKALLLLLDEAIDASLRRLCENGISAARDCFLLHLVPPGVRYSEGPWNVVHQGMISRLRLSEDTDAFGRQLVALHAIHVQDGRMDGETGIHRRDRILLGPVHDLGEGGPIRLFRQAGSSRFGAGPARRERIACTSGRSISARQTRFPPS